MFEAPVKGAFRSFLPCLGLLLSTSADAATHCVDTALELAMALDAAEVNGEDDEIRIVTGTYSGAFHFLPPSGMDDGKDLVIRGGHIEFLGACLHVALDPALTVLKAGPAAEVLTIFRETSTPLTVRVEGLTLRDGRAGLWLQVTSTAANQIEVLGNRIVENLKFPVFLNLGGASTQVRFFNNLIADNGDVGDANRSGATIWLPSNATGSISNNTITSNDVGSKEALHLRCPTVATVSLFDNILIDNVGTDLSLDADCAVNSTHNDIGTQLGSADSGCCDLSQDPGFIAPAAGDYRLAFDSPLIDIADVDPPGGAPTTDILGNPRPDVPGGVRDVGALEMRWIFADGFESGDTSAWSVTVP